MKVTRTIKNNPLARAGLAGGILAAICCLGPGLVGVLTGALALGGIGGLLTHSDFLIEGALIALLAILGTTGYTVWRRRTRKRANGG